MYKRFFTILTTCLLSLTLSAQTLSEQSVVSLITCTPGVPLYLHFGHSALRVCDPAFTNADGNQIPVDWTFNYGIFSFDTEHFYTKFVRGETDYMLAIQNTDYFEASSRAEGRDVFEQVLHLTLAERQNILDHLIENYRPENRVYRYNFVFDNCATRPLRLIETALPTLVIPEDTLSCTWRDQISYYAGRYTWGQFGINLVFGRLADERMTLAESLFLPENLMNFIQQSGLVERGQIGIFIPRDGRFSSSPQLAVIIICLLLALVTWYDVTHRKQSYWLDMTLYCVYIILSLIMGFLMFFSTHPFVTENANWLVLTPLWMIPLVLCCWKRGRRWHTRIEPGIFLFVMVEMLLVLCSGQTFHLMLLIPLVHAIRLFTLYLTTRNSHA